MCLLVQPMACVHAFNCAASGMLFQVLLWVGRWPKTHQTPSKSRSVLGMRADGNEQKGPLWGDRDGLYINTGV